jgi:hypothetical protein
VWRQQEREGDNIDREWEEQKNVVQWTRLTFIVPLRKKRNSPKSWAVFFNRGRGPLLVSSIIHLNKHTHKIKEWKCKQRCWHLLVVCVLQVILRDYVTCDTLMVWLTTDYNHKFKFSFFLLIEIECCIPRGVRHAGSLGEENGDWNHIHSNMETKLTLF